MTRKQKKIENVKDTLIGLFGYWTRKLRIRKLTVLVVDKITSMNSAAYVMKESNGTVTCTIDPKRFVEEKCDKHDFIAAVFHELGHIKTDSFYSDGMPREQAEYNAETQALRWLKKYFPKHYKEHVRRMKRVLKTNPWTGKQAYYTTAFKRIKDYND